MSLLDAALKYASIGWHVFPCEPPELGVDTSGKRPLTKNGKDDATCDEAKIRAWWDMFPNANIGIATKPSNLVVLDVDTAIDKKTGQPKQGAASLATMNEHLTPTLTARTGSGAIHAVYARGDAEARQQLHIRPGIDLLGNGYFIAAPSKHWTGGEYSWLNAATASIAPLPEYLRTIQREAAAREPSTPSSNTGVVIPEKNARIMAAARLAEGWPSSGRHMAFLALAGGLAQSGWSEAEITEFTTSVARLMPGCDEKAIADRAPQARDSVMRVERGERVEGWGALASFVPQDVLDAVQDRLGITIHDFDHLTPARKEATELTLEALQMSAESYIAEHPDAVPALAAGGGLIVMAEDLALIDYPPVVSFPTGFDELDRLLGGGFSTQQLIVLLGKPGAGKTAFIIGCALTCENAAPILYVSTELQHNEILARLCSPLLGVPWRDIVRHKAVLPDGTKITKEMCHAALRGKRIAIIGQDEIYKAGEKAIGLIASTAKAMKGKYGAAPITFVDYMQELARGDDAKAKAKNTMVAVAFRMLSQHLDCSIVAVSSVSRGGYGNAAQALRDADNPEAYLALAKESGDIDYAAATIAFLDVGEERDGEGWRAGRIAVSKSRHGETGFAGLRFHGATGRFESFAAGVQLLSGETVKASKTEKRQAELEAKVLSKVSELVAYGVTPEGLSQLKSKTDLKAIVGGNGQECGAVIDRLVREGKLIEKSEQSYNPATKQLNKPRNVLTLPDGASAITPRTEGPPMDLGALMAGIVGTDPA